MANQGGEKNYIRVLENHKRKLGDYEQVHFRKSVVARGRLPSEITLSRKRPPKPQLAPLDKNNAALYLRQTENLWLSPTMSRQEATKSLFDKPTGSFVVRNSQKARYALTVRLPTSDPAVSHFLIQTNQQGFLTIQGSNLPFLSIYDLLAYFCFHQSGGMPCLLHAPDPTKMESRATSSDSSDSEGEEYDDVHTKRPEDQEQPRHPFRPRSGDLSTIPETPPPTPPPKHPVLPPGGTSSPTSPPPPVPPRSIYASRREITMVYSADMGTHLVTKGRVTVVDPYPVREEIFIDHQRQSDYLQQQKNEANLVQRTQQGERESLPPVKRKPPPKPPRTFPVEDEQQEEEEEIKRAIKRVSSIVDIDIKKLYQHFAKQSPPPPPLKPKPYHRLRSGSKEAEISRSSEHLARNSSSPRASPKKGSPSHVMSLIQKFESYSPPLQHSPPSPRRKPPVSHTQSSDLPPLPAIPPRPKAPPAPPVPPKPLLPSDPNPVLPPRTPAPQLHPKPPGSKPPFLLPRERWRSNSDSRLRQERGVVFAPEDSEVLPACPPRPKWRLQRRETPPIAMEEEEIHTPMGNWLLLPGFPPRDGLSPTLHEHEKEGTVEGEGEGVPQDAELSDLSESLAGTSISQLPGSSEKPDESHESNATSVKSSGLKWKPPGWAKKLRKFKKPRKRIKKFIVELAKDQTHEFGRRINEFISDMRGRTDEPYQTVLSEIREFISLMHDFLLDHHQSGLVNCGMESCSNFEHVAETSLQQCILQPLSHHAYLRIENHFEENGHLFQVQRSIYQSRNKTPEEMGIRKHLVVPGEKALGEIADVFQRMMKTPCAISKLEYLLEAVRLTYENVRDSRQPKKPMTSDLGADDFLPLFVWVLVQCSFFRAEIEAEYMWGLAHPSLFNGEAGYYLTTLTSAVNVLKEFSQPAAPPVSDIQKLPAMNNLQTELKVFFEDENTGQFSSAYYLPILPRMTAAEICEILAERHGKANPQDYALFAVINGQATMIQDHERPQVLKMKWTLERTSRLATTKQPSRFIAYKLRAPLHR